MEELFLILGAISLLLLIAGLVKPVYVLWWMAHQNRIRVIRVYGSAVLIFISLYVLLGWL